MSPTGKHFFSTNINLLGGGVFQERCFFLSVLWFKMGGALLGKGDVRYFNAPIKLKQFMDKNQAVSKMTPYLLYSAPYLPWATLFECYLIHRCKNYHKEVFLNLKLLLTIE